MLILSVLPGLAASLEGEVMGVEACGEHEGITVFVVSCTGPWPWW